MFVTENTFLLSSEQRMITIRSFEESSEDEEEDIMEEKQSSTNLQHLPEIKPSSLKSRRKRYNSYHDVVELVCITAFLLRLMTPWRIKAAYYRSRPVTSNTVNPKFHLIQTFGKIFATFLSFQC